MSSVEKLDGAETDYGSIKDEPKTGGGLKFIVVGMLIGAFFGVLGTMALMTPHAPLAQFSEDQQRKPCPLNCVTFSGQCVTSDPTLSGYVCQCGSMEEPDDGCWPRVRED